METTSFENNVGDRIRPQIEQAKQQLGQLNGRITTFIKDHPAACLLGAVALGYLDRVVERDRLRDEVEQEAQRLCQLHAPSYVATKARLNQRALDAVRSAIETDLAAG